MIDDLYNIGDEFPSVSAIAKYDIAKDLLTELICLDMDPVSINISPVDYSGYDKEYIITIDEYGVCCQEAYSTDRYLYTEDNVLYIHEDCNSGILKYVRTDGDKVFEFAIESEECNCKTCSNYKKEVAGNDHYYVTVKTYLGIDDDDMFKLLSDWNL